MIPQNNVLYVDQFSSLAGCELFRPATMEDVFHHYAPTIEVQLKNENGEYFTEEFHFHRLADFDDEQLIAQSPTLQYDIQRREACQTIGRHFTRNVPLKKLLANPGARQDLRQAFILMGKAASAPCQEQELQAPDEAMLQDCLERLREYGGKDLMKMLTRDAGRFMLDLWAEFLEDNRAMDCWEKEVTSCEKNIGENLTQIRSSIKEQETAYRTLGLFFSNTRKERINFLTIFNVENKCNLDQLTSPDSRAIISELKNKYDRLDLSESYSLLVIPGYLNYFPDSNIDTWARVAYDNKVLLVTDFQDCLDQCHLDILVKEIPLQGSLPAYSRTIVTCNYILKRRKSEWADEDEDLYIPASGALAGRMTDVEHIPISQGIAGRNYGRIEDAPSVRFDIKRVEQAKYIELGLVPVVEVSGQVYAFSNSTLYLGSMRELQKYPVVRVFDWVWKVLLQYCNHQSNTIWDRSLEVDMKRQIEKLLHETKNNGNLFDDFSISQIERDEQTGNIIIKVELKPFFAQHSFPIELKGISQQGKLNFHLEDTLLTIVR